MSIFLINLYYFLLLDVASTSPPNSRGFVSTSVSSSNSAITDYEVEVVEIRVQEGELKNIIPWVFSFLFAPLSIFHPSSSFIVFVCQPSFIIIFLFSGVSLSLCSLIRTTYTYMTSTSLFLFFFSLTYSFFFFLLPATVRHSTHTKLNLRLQSYCIFFDKYMINFKFRWSFFFVHTHTEPETWYLACNNSSCHEFIYIDIAVILVICQWLS